MPITANIRNPMKPQGLRAPNAEQARKGHNLQKKFNSSHKFWQSECELEKIKDIKFSIFKLSPIIQTSLTQSRNSHLIITIQ